MLDQRLRINDLAVAAGGENAAKLLNLTVPSKQEVASSSLVGPPFNFFVFSTRLPSLSSRKTAS